MLRSTEARAPPWRSTVVWVAVVMVVTTIPPPMACVLVSRSITYTLITCVGTLAILIGLLLAFLAMLRGHHHSWVFLYLRRHLRRTYRSSLACAGTSTTPIGFHDWHPAILRGHHHSWVFLSLRRHLRRLTGLSHYSAYDEASIMLFSLLRLRWDT